MSENNNEGYLIFTGDIDPLRRMDTPEHMLADHALSTHRAVCYTADCSAERTVEGTLDDLQDSLARHRWIFALSARTEQWHLYCPNCQEKAVRSAMLWYPVRHTKDLF